MANEPIKSDEKTRTWNAGKIIVDIDCADALKGLKAVTREAKKATAALKEFEEAQKQSEFGNPLLQIVLDDITSVPKVVYKGKEVRKKVRVSFDWKTNDDGHLYTPKIRIEYASVNGLGKPHINIVGHEPAFGLDGKK